MGPGPGSWPRPRLPVRRRPDTRVGSDSKDPHRSRGSYPPPAAAVRNANLVERAIHLARGPSADPPVLPPLRSPAAFVKAAHWPLLLCAACHALPWTPSSWCGPGNAARKTAVARRRGRVLSLQRTEGFAYNDGRGSPSVTAAVFAAFPLSAEPGPGTDVARGEPSPAAADVCSAGARAKSSAPG